MPSNRPKTLKRFGFEISKVAIPFVSTRDKKDGHFRYSKANSLSFDSYLDGVKI